MTISNSRLSYQDCYQFLEQAMESSKGIRIKMPSHDDATFMRMRIHQARKLDRQQNAKIFEEGDPMHGCSHYDKITVRIRVHNQDVFVYLEQTAVTVLGVEDLETMEEIPLVTDIPMPQIEHKPEPVPPEDELAESVAEELPSARRRF